MNKVNPSTNRTRKVYEAPLEVRAGSPLVKILGKSVKGLTDPAKLWTK